ncbi:MAG: carboxypeptidase regulatory-like domain-containing protein [Candidatus Sumerlaea chitinivorans]|nr:carboxypeptidase regulatory-like domain-containing protein [Candidatus Sumerlaea chitinivorans]
MKNRGVMWVVLALCLVTLGLWTLRRQVERLPKESKQEEVVSADDEAAYDEDVARNRAAKVRFTSLALEPIPTPRAAAQVKRLVEVERREGHDADKVRAVGDALLYGTVRSEDRQPIPGATVQLLSPDPEATDPPLRECVTDTSGTYRIEKINGSGMLYCFLARAEGFAPTAGLFFLNQQEREHNVTLERGDELSGRVVDAVTSLPIPRAKVYFPVKNKPSYAVLGTISTSAMGEFRFDHAPKGNVIVTVEADGYMRTEARLRVPRTDAVIALRPGGAVVRGVTVSRLTRKPEGGAKVLAILEGGSITTTRTDDEGRFELKDLPAGQIKLIGYKGMPGEAVDLTLREREVKEGVELVLPSPLFVSGKVVHAFNGKPLPGIRIYYAGPAGKGSVLSDEQGLFAFETLVVDEYVLEVHEKGFLPLFDRETTGSGERITRKISRNASSDQVRIRLRPVPCIEGKVVRGDRNGKVVGPAMWIDVPVTYQQRGNIERVMTRTDSLGQFFVNLSSGRRGNAKIIVQRGRSIGAASTRIPTRRQVEIVLRPTRMSGELYLVDQTPLAGVLVTSSYLFPEGVATEKATRLPGASDFVGNRGDFYLLMPEKEKVELAFHLPDGKTVTKIFDTDALLRRRHIFIYDPVAGDILNDVGRPTPRGNSR